jgi:hypothetical protein
VTELSESTLRLLDQTLVTDAHETTPSHLSGNTFGEAAGRIAALRRCPRLPASRYSTRACAETPVR